jgi:threonine dehydrogenase-like Zn-dependent dehydrogenase
VGPGQEIGIVGLGGRGHMALKFANAMGTHVTLFTSSPGKIADGKRLGAHEVVVSNDDAQMQKHAGRFNFILDAVSAQHDLGAYLNLLKRDGYARAPRRAGQATVRPGISRCCSAAARSPARSSVDWPRLRRCWISAESITSRATLR